MIVVPAALPIGVPGLRAMIASAIVNRTVLRGEFRPPEAPPIFPGWRRTRRWVSPAARIGGVVAAGNGGAGVAMRP